MFGRFDDSSAAAEEARAAWRRLLENPRGVHYDYHPRYAGMRGASVQAALTLPEEPGRYLVVVSRDRNRWGRIFDFLDDAHGARAPYYARIEEGANGELRIMSARPRLWSMDLGGGDLVRSGTGGLILPDDGRPTNHRGHDLPYLLRDLIDHARISDVSLLGLRN